MVHYRLLLCGLFLVGTVARSEAIEVAPKFQTTDATVQNYPYSGPVVPPESSCRHRVLVFASNHAGDVAMWTLDVLTRRLGSSTVSNVGTPVKSATPGASSWAITPVYATGAIQMQVQGAAGVTIDWLFTNDESFCMVGNFVP